MRIVFDSNLYIAAFYKGGHLFDLLLRLVKKESGFFLFISEEIYEEVERKLKTWVKDGKLSEESFKDYLFVLSRTITWVQPKETITTVKDDPDDDRVLECAVAAEANIIVTMDKHLLKLKVFRNIAIVHPNTFKHFSSKL